MRNQRSCLVSIMAIAIATIGFTTTARAQVDVDSAVAHAGAGAGISFIKPSSNDGQTSQGVVFVYHWHSFHSGWGPSFGVDWHSTDYTKTMGSVSTTLGTLQTRALLVGYGHTKKIKRFATSANVNGGYSFNNYSVASGAAPAFANGGISLVGVSTDNSWVVRPDVSAWYDVFRHMAVGVSAAYLWSRPNQTVTTLAGSDTRRLNADAFELTVGVAVGVWKKHS